VTWQRGARCLPAQLSGSVSLRALPQGSDGRSIGTAAGTRGREGVNRASRRRAQQCADRALHVRVHMDLHELTGFHRPVGLDGEPII